MKIIFNLTILVLLLSTIILAKKPEDPAPGVIDVTSSNSASVFAKEVDALVEFYAPWCGHCKNLAVDFALVGSAIEKSKPENVVVAKVDCTKEKAICSKYGVSGYPTIKFFPKGQTTPEDYKGGRKADDFIKFINQKSGARLFLPREPSFVNALDESDFDSTVFVKGKTALVMFYAPWCGHCKTLKPIFEKLGKAFESEANVVIAKVDATQAKELGTRYGVKGYPTLKWITFDNKVEDAKVGRSLDVLVQYVNDKSGTFRAETGLLNEKAALYGPLGVIVKKFLAGTQEDKDKLIAEGEETLKGLPSTFNARQTGYYVRAMKKINVKGNEFVKKEKVRLENLMKSKSVSQKSLDSFKTRLNILGEF